MLVKICLLIVLAAIVMAAPVDDKNIDESLPYEVIWPHFKSKHNKSYETPEEEEKRFKIFKDNVDKIREHNKKYAAGETTFTMGINSFADLTHEEFSATHLGLLTTPRPGSEHEHKLLGSH